MKLPPKGRWRNLLRRYGRSPNTTAGRRTRPIRFQRKTESDAEVGHVGAPPAAPLLLPARLRGGVDRKHALDRDADDIALAPAHAHDEDRVLLRHVQLETIGKRREILRRELGA